MVKDLKSAIKKLTLPEGQKLIAGNQLYQKEKQALFVTSTFLVLPMLITGILLLIHNAG